MAPCAVPLQPVLVEARLLEAIQDVRRIHTWSERQVQTVVLAYHPEDLGVPKEVSDLFGETAGGGMEARIALMHRAVELTLAQGVSSWWSPMLSRWTRWVSAEVGVTMCAPLVRRILDFYARPSSLLRAELAEIAKITQHDPSAWILLVAAVTQSFAVQNGERRPNGQPIIHFRRRELYWLLRETFGGMEGVALADGQETPLGLRWKHCMQEERWDAEAASWLLPQLSGLYEDKADSWSMQTILDVVAHPGPLNRRLWALNYFKHWLQLSPPTKDIWLKHLAVRWSSLLTENTVQVELWTAIVGGTSSVSAAFQLERGRLRPSDPVQVARIGITFPRRWMASLRAMVGRFTKVSVAQRMGCSDAIMTLLDIDASRVTSLLSTADWVWCLSSNQRYVPAWAAKHMPVSAIERLTKAQWRLLLVSPSKDIRVWAMRQMPKAKH